MIGEDPNVWKTLQVDIPDQPKTRSKQYNVISWGRIQGHKDVPLCLTPAQDNYYMQNLSSISKLIYVYARLEHESTKGERDCVAPIYIGCEDLLKKC